jgi:hypothetical protein
MMPVKKSPWNRWADHGGPVHWIATRCEQCEQSEQSPRQQAGRVQLKTLCSHHSHCSQFPDRKRHIKELCSHHSLCSQSTVGVEIGSASPLHHRRRWNRHRAV